MRTNPRLLLVKKLKHFSTQKEAYHKNIKNGEKNIQKINKDTNNIAD